MERPILGRYAHTQEGEVLVDIAINRIEDLYNNYDRSAPYLKKDLDPELVDYLVDSVRELRGAPFAIRFGIESLPDKAAKKRLRQSIGNYFSYLMERERRELRQMFRTSLLLLLVGLTILTVAVWVNQGIATDGGVIGKVFAEGLTVAAWVSLWESLATFLINWAPHRRTLRLYQRIGSAPVHFLSLG